MILSENLTLVPKSTWTFSLTSQNSLRACCCCCCLFNLVKHVIKLFREATDDLVIIVLVNWFKQHNSDICKTTYICALSSSLSEGSGKRQKKTMHFCLFLIFFLNCK